MNKLFAAISLLNTTGIIKRLLRNMTSHLLSTHTQKKVT